MSQVTVVNCATESSYALSRERLSVRQALSDMFNRLRRGAAWSQQGAFDGLVIQKSVVLYGESTGDWIYHFLFPAANRPSDIRLNTPEHVSFIRCKLLAATGHELSEVALENALKMPEDTFFGIMTEAITHGYPKPQRFEPKTQ